MKNKIYIIHENDEWIEPLRKELNSINAPFEEWHLGKRNIDYLDKPPQGVFYKGMKSIAEFLKKELLLLSNIKVVA